MLGTHQFRKGICVGICTVLVALVPSSFADQSLYGVLMVVKGDIKIIHSSNQVENAKVGSRVVPGDSIQSGPDSRAKIVMSDKNVLNISPDSKVKIEKYTNNGTDKNVEIKVEFGKIRASVEQKYDGEKSTFNVKTPSAVAGVRGTDFLTSYSPKTKQSQVVTFSGTVAFGLPGAGGKILNPVFVQPGQMTQAAEGRKVEAPKAVPAEDLNKMKLDVAQAPASKDSGEKSKQAGGPEQGKKSGDEKNSPSLDGQATPKPGGADLAGPKDGSADRAPASFGPGGPMGSMIDAKDLAPEMAKDVRMGPAMPSAPAGFVQPGLRPVIPNQFLNEVGRNPTSKTTIIINN